VLNLLSFYQVIPSFLPSFLSSKVAFYTVTVKEDSTCLLLAAVLIVLLVVLIDEAESKTATPCKRLGGVNITQFDGSVFVQWKKAPLNTFNYKLKCLENSATTPKLVFSGNATQYISFEKAKGGIPFVIGSTYKCKLTCSCLQPSGIHNRKKKEEINSKPLTALLLYCSCSTN